MVTGHHSALHATTLLPVLGWVNFTLDAVAEVTKLRLGTAQYN